MGITVRRWTQLQLYAYVTVRCCWSIAARAPAAQRLAHRIAVPLICVKTASKLTMSIAVITGMLPSATTSSPISDKWGQGGLSKYGRYGHGLAYPNDRYGYTSLSLWSTTLGNIHTLLGHHLTAPQSRRKVPIGKAWDLGEPGRSEVSVRGCSAASLADQCTVLQATADPKQA